MSCVVQIRILFVANTVDFHPAGEQNTFFKQKLGAAFRRLFPSRAAGQKIRMHKAVIIVAPSPFSLPFQSFSSVDFAMFHWGFPSCGGCGALTLFGAVLGRTILPRYDLHEYAIAGCI